MRKALDGLVVVDLSVNAPGPFASKMLADLGAEVTSIANPAGAPEYSGAKDDPMLAARGGPNDALAQGKSTIALNLKSKEGKAQLLALLDVADVLISEMRPGKLEALGLGWETLCARNPRLVVCEISGYGPLSPRALRAGHDINYLAQAGALALIRDTNDKPIAPQNIIGDYAAGGSMAVAGILAAVLERGRTGVGKHIEVSMTDGVEYLMADITAATLIAGHPEASWRETLSGGMPTYDTYRTKDGGWIAVGALEPKFIKVLAEGLEWPELPDLMAHKLSWPTAREGLAERFERRTSQDWDRIFGDTDACVTPVLTLADIGGQRVRTLPEVFGHFPAEH